MYQRVIVCANLSCFDLVSELEPELPARPLAAWFRDIVGKQAGVNWQLNECGSELDPQSLKARDLPACVEARALLPDNRKVAVLIEVGTFQKGISGRPRFSFAVIEMQGDLFGIHRLQDLEASVREPARLRASQSLLLRTMDNHYISALSEMIGARSPDIEGSENDIPPPPLSSGESRPEMRRVSEGVLQGAAIRKVQPLYPAGAKKSLAAGKVEVQVTISEAGQVIKAIVVSGHPLLRRAAIEAARKWTFNPATLNGVPTAVQSTLSFYFTAP